MNGKFRMKNRFTELERRNARREPVHARRDEYGHRGQLDQGPGIRADGPRVGRDELTKPRRNLLYVGEDQPPGAARDVLASTQTEESDVATRAKPAARMFNTHGLCGV